MQIKITVDLDKKINTIIKKIKDLALFQGTLPSYFAQIARELNDIQSDMTYFNPPQSGQNTFSNEIKEAQHKLNQLGTHIITFDAEAKRIADQLTTQHDSSIRKFKNYFSNNQEGIYTRLGDPRGNSILFNKNVSIFPNNASFQRKTWLALRCNLEYYSSLIDFKSTSHNTLSLLLVDNDELFLDNINFGRLPLEGEIGYLAFQRLKDIATHNKPLRKRVNQLQLLAFPEIESEGLASYNDDALYNEFYKLAMYSLINPTNKVVWLGTARTVEAVRDRSPGEGIYLNPLPEHYSWELNRAWLQAAYYLGYEFKLVEQHFPNIEEAILSGDPCKFITVLLNEIRSENQVSQYNGNFSPTATPQEVLALMDMGCIAQKNEDNSLSLISPKSKESLDKIKTNANILGLKRSHSAPCLFRSSPVPPLAERKDNFVAPEQSKTGTKI